jgi:hypothetical protein
MGGSRPGDSSQLPAEHGAGAHEWPDSGATEEVFVRVYRGYLSWWTILALDLPLRE